MILDIFRNKESIMENSLKADTYSCRFLESGVVSYGNEVVLIKYENLMRIAETFRGIPVVIGHQAINEDETVVCGYISKVYMQDDGWAWCDFIITSPDAKRLIDQEEYSISCAYYPRDTAQGGVYHNIPYDREIVSGEADHLAIVNNPRYEDALIIKNSKDELMIFKSKKQEETLKNSDDKEVEKKENEASAEEEEKKENECESESKDELENSEDEEKKESKEEDCKENEIDESDYIFEVDEEKVPLETLKNAYRAMKKNASEDKEEEKKEEKEEKMENAKDEKSFDMLKNARAEGMKVNNEPAYLSLSDKLALGSKNY